MRRMNNLITLFSAIFAFFFGSFLTTIVTNIEKCPSKTTVSKLEQNHDIFLMVLVLSAPNYIDKRQIIRDTWLKVARPLVQPYYPEDFVYVPDYDEDGFLEMESVAEQSNRIRNYLDWLDGVENAVASRRFIKIKHYFAIGTQNLSPVLMGELRKEQNEFNDMLFLLDVRDSYANLTKKLISSLEHLTNHESFTYLLKVDDDSYVKMDYLVNELVSFDRKLIRKSSEYKTNPIPELYWGFFNGRAAIKTRGQWKEEHYYICSKYAPYALGGGYVISRSIAEYIDANSQILNTYVSEDISMGTWLAPLRNIYRRHDIRFDTGYMPRKCRRQHIVLHKRTIQQMKDLYEGKLCTFEVPKENTLKRPLEYYYDWKKPAESCCNNIAV
ncbi:beta-1,3-galactosyltransferase 6 [Episyrphus balteatus]|uniref:beta-1,3-galactosyltransferase 6 n=1 Tax=Episyrphus balteatus TaxID=286459 RepID=UPI002484F4B1|nr:beta-1,3-galactosyltransferase 6 [Episyrphus balteatus]